MRQAQNWLLGALTLGSAQYFYIGGRVILVQLAALGLFWLNPRFAALRPMLQ